MMMLMVTGYWLKWSQRQCSFQQLPNNFYHKTWPEIVVSKFAEVLGNFHRDYSGSLTILFVNLSNRYQALPPMKVTGRLLPVKCWSNLARVWLLYPSLAFWRASPLRRPSPGRTSTEWIRAKSWSRWGLPIVWARLSPPILWRAAFRGQRWMHRVGLPLLLGVGWNLNALLFEKTIQSHKRSYLCRHVC